jgi:hypothetical protein
MARVVLPNWEPKDPTDDADYWYDWGSDVIPELSRFLGPTVTITSHEIDPLTGTLDLVDSSHTTKVVRVRFSGGTAGVNYPVTCRITTNTGEVFEVTATLKVRERLVA